MTKLGPFSYREVREKQNIVQVQETISYGSYIAYEFDREASCEECEFNTNVTVINPVIVMIDWTLEKVRLIKLALMSGSVLSSRSRNLCPSFCLSLR